MLFFEGKSMNAVYLTGCVTCISKCIYYVRYPIHLKSIHQQTFENTGCDYTAVQCQYYFYFNDTSAL